MPEAYICDAVRTAFGRYGGALATVRTDDLAAIPIRALQQRNANLDWGAVDDVFLGCANQAGEDNRNVARMAVLLAGLPHTVPAATINRLCGSGMDAVALGARAIRSGDADLVIAGGVENMTRAPFVLGKSDVPFARSARLEDTTMGWRFVNPALERAYGVETMPQTAENIVEEFGIPREAQDEFAFRSHQRWAAAQARGVFDEEIASVEIPQRKGETKVFQTDEHPRPDTTLDALRALKGVVKLTGSVTAGNSSGINDGSCALLLASDKGAKRFGLRPRARIVATATAGVLPRVMGIGPVPATDRVLSRAGLTLSQIDVVEINEAFAVQVLAVTRLLGLADDAAHVNPNGGAIAIGHPLGASGARLLTTATSQLERIGGRFGLCTMCIGVGQGIAMVIERV